MPSVVSSRVYTYIKLPAGTLSKPTPQERPTWNETNKKKNRTHSKSSRSSNPLVQWFIRISNSIARTHHRIGLIAILFCFSGRQILCKYQFHCCVYRNFTGALQTFSFQNDRFFETHIFKSFRVSTHPPLHLMLLNIPFTFFAGPLQTVDFYIVELVTRDVTIADEWIKLLRVHVRARGTRPLGAIFFSSPQQPHHENLGASVDAKTSRFWKWLDLRIDD